MFVHSGSEGNGVKLSIPELSAENVLVHLEITSKKEGEDTSNTPAIFVQKSVDTNRLKHYSLVKIPFVELCTKILVKDQPGPLISV
jgi:hypothetical protein